MSGEILAPGDCDVQLRMISMGKPHLAIPLTGALCTAVAARIPGTVVADLVEAAALGEALGDRVPVSSTKAQLGHLMGATAGVELVSMILTLQRGLIPACRNLDDPDPRCALNFVRGEPLKASVTFALKTSFAFGGTNSVAILRRWDEADASPAGDAASA